MVYPYNNSDFIILAIVILTHPVKFPIPICRPHNVSEIAGVNALQDLHL